MHFIDAVDAGFININFEDVIQRENQLVIAEGCGEDASQELIVVQAFLLALNWPEVWTISDVVRHALFNNDNRVFVQSYNSFADHIVAFINAVRADSEYMKKSLSRSCSARREKPKYCTATRELWTRCFDFMPQNRTMNMPGKEWHDVFHTIVPVAYCNIAFLDGHWETFVSQSGLKPPAIAEVFTKRSLEAGIDAVEGWAPGKVSPAHL